MASLTVLFIRRVSGLFQEVEIKTVVKKFRQAWSSGDYSGICILALMTFAEWPSIVTCVFFVIVKEYSIWWGGLQEESFRHIGQWGVLLGSALLAVAGWTGRDNLASTPESKRQQQDQEQKRRSWGRGNKSDKSRTNRSENNKIHNSSRSKGVLQRRRK
jgi:hypothetical protein